MQVSTAELQRVLDATHRLLRLQSAASLNQAIADSVLTIFDVSGSALFLVEGANGTLAAVAGSCVVSPLGACHPTDALLNVTESGTLAVPVRAGDNVLAVLWIRWDRFEPAAFETSVPLRLFVTQVAAALENAREYQSLIAVDSKRQDGIATVAHELRTPLGAIVNALHVLDRLGAPDARVLALRELIRRQTGHLTKLVEDVLDLARLRHGKLRLETKRMDLREVVGLVVDTVRAAGRAGDHELRDRLGTVPLFVDGDATRLEQVVRNLIDNAVKYSPQGSVITVSTDEDGTTAALRVRDEGGIAPDMLSRLFEPFAQAEAGGQRAAGGLGLGLPLVHAIVEQHGGTIAANSDGVGKGTEFVVRLPLRPSP
jgi:signal transduction histidine kinase